MSWAFALVNNKLAELYFERRGKTIRMGGYCHVERSEFITRKELGEIDFDTKKYQLSYRNGRYRDNLSGKIFVSNEWTKI